MFLLARLLNIILHSELASLDDLYVLGDVFGIIGKIVTDDQPHLLLIGDADVVGELGPVDEPVYRVRRALALPIVDDGSIKPIPEPPLSSSSSSHALNKLKNQQRQLLDLVSRGAAVASPAKLIDEIIRLINESENFYFCRSLDLTLNTQRFVHLNMLFSAFAA